MTRMRAVVGFAVLLSTAPVATAQQAPPSYEPSAMSESRHAPLPPIVIPTRRPAPDLRPVWVGGGLVLLAAALWWNQRRRARLEQQHSADVQKRS